MKMHYKNKKIKMQWYKQKDVMHNQNGKQQK